MTLSPQDKLAVEAQREAHALLTPTHDSGIPNLLTGDALASLLSSRAPGVGLKRYNASAVTIDPEHFIPGPVPVYLASEVDASNPHEYTAENIGEAPEGQYQAALGGEWFEGYADKATWIHRLTRPFAQWPKMTTFFGPIPQPPRS